MQTLWLLRRWRMQGMRIWKPIRTTCTRRTAMRHSTTSASRSAFMPRWRFRQPWSSTLAAIDPALAFKIAENTFVFSGRLRTSRSPAQRTPSPTRESWRAACAGRTSGASRRERHCRHAGLPLRLPLSLRASQHGRLLERRAVAPVLQARERKAKRKEEEARRQQDEAKRCA
jgi:hypothetical protein